MGGILSVSGVGIAVFAVTDIDDLLVLVAFFSDPAYRPREVVLGQYLGISVLIGLSALSHFLNLILPSEWIGLVGLLPIALGIKGALELRSQGTDTEPEIAVSPPSAFRGGARSVAVASVTVANGGDNIGAYVPLFAASTPLQVALIAGIFLFMTAVWLCLARAIVGNRLFGQHLRRWGRVLLPFVLIGLGVFVLVDQGSYRLLAGLFGR